MGAASSRDHLISRLEPLSQGVFYGNLDFPDKRLKKNRDQILFGPDFCLGFLHITVHNITLKLNYIKINDHIGIKQQYFAFF